VSVTPIRRLDHVAVAVRDTAKALEYFSGRLGLTVAHQEELTAPPVRLTYLDCGNAWLQLVEPLDAESELARAIAARGEGLHHLCFGVDDVPSAVEELSEPGLARRPLGSGRGRPSGFVANGQPHGVLVECTGFVEEEDVDGAAGWLPRP
jgi:methylmalonyl-CoA/ethylmalonyl-CoA epimerase